MDSKAFLAADVSKGYADFLLLDSQQNALEKSFQLLDTKEGRTQLGKLIKVWKEQGLQQLYCGVESTGGYENNWYSFLKNLQSKGEGVLVSRLNPKAVKSLSDASLKRTITDEVSAENIALYLIKFSEKIDYGLNYVSDNGFKEGRQHLNCIKMHNKQKTQLSNQLEKLLYQYFSEILVYCRNGLPYWLLNLLIKYPTAALVVKAAKRLSNIHGISESKAKSLIDKSKKSDQKISDQIAHVISVTASEILHKEIVIKQEKEYLTSLYKDSEEAKLLVSIPGIGIESAVTVALEIEDVKRFETAKKMSSYFGVHPTFKESGDGIWGNHMSKKGRGEIRAVLYMACRSGVRYNPVLKEVYARARARGMNHSQAAGVAMHKLLRLIYGILKNKQPFDPKIDTKNQERSKEKQTEKEIEIKNSKKIKQNKKYRFQELSSEGPISARNAQKRKKQIASQSSKEVNTGLLPADTNI